MTAEACKNWDGTGWGGLITPVRFSQNGPQNACAQCPTVIWHTRYRRVLCMMVLMLKVHNEPSVNSVFGSQWMERGLGT